MVLITWRVLKETSNSIYFEQINNLVHLIDVDIKILF